MPKPDKSAGNSEGRSAAVLICKLIVRSRSSDKRLIKKFTNWNYLKSVQFAIICLMSKIFQICPFSSFQYFSITKSTWTFLLLMTKLYILLFKKFLMLFYANILLFYSKIMWKPIHLASTNEDVTVFCFFNQSIMLLMFY